VTEYVRVCRDCGEQYRPGVAVCADCGGALEDRPLDDDGQPVESTAAAAIPAQDATSHRVVFVTPRAAELVPLAEALREAEIGHRLAEQAPVGDGAPVRYALLVEEDDAEEALRALGPVLVPEDHAAEAHALETRFADGRGYVECPACGTKQAEGATECPECGLGLGSAAATCALCGEPLPEPEADCPACGASAPR
jgi:uncharacterized OB-fold protein